MVVSVAIQVIQIFANKMVAANTKISLPGTGLSFAKNTIESLFLSLCEYASNFNSFPYLILNGSLVWQLN